MQYLYESGDEAVMMDMSDYDQVPLPKSVAGEALDWILPNDEVDVLFVDGSPGDVQVPSAVEMEVKETEPGVRGDTASGGGNKPAVLESGVTVHVPLFVNAGDRVRVDTRTGEYVSRA
jgi:elongation factor P